MSLEEHGKAFDSSQVVATAGNFCVATLSYELGIKTPFEDLLLNFVDKVTNCKVYTFLDHDRKIGEVYLDQNFNLEELPEIIKELGQVLTDPYGETNIDHRPTQDQKDRKISVNAIPNTNLAAKMTFRYTNLRALARRGGSKKGGGKSDFEIMRKAFIKCENRFRNIAICNPKIYIYWENGIGENKIIDAMIMENLSEGDLLGDITQEQLLSKLSPDTLAELDLTEISTKTILKSLQLKLMLLDIDTQDLHEKNVFIRNGKIIIIDL